MKIEWDLASMWVQRFAVHSNATKGTKEQGYLRARLVVFSKDHVEDISFTIGAQDNGIIGLSQVLLSGTRSSYFDMEIL